MHVHVSSLPGGPILNWKLHTLWLLKTINSFAPDVVGPNKIELQSWPWQTKVILITTILAAACMALECTMYMYKIMLQMGMALRYASTAKKRALRLKDCWKLLRNITNRYDFDYSRPLFNRYRSRIYVVMGLWFFCVSLPGYLRFSVNTCMHDVFTAHTFKWISTGSPICQFGTQG